MIGTMHQMGHHGALWCGVGGVVMLHQHEPSAREYRLEGRVHAKAATSALSASSFLDRTVSTPACGSKEMVCLAEAIHIHTHPTR